MRSFFASLLVAALFCSASSAATGYVAITFTKYVNGSPTAIPTDCAYWNASNIYCGGQTKRPRIWLMLQYQNGPSMVFTSDVYEYLAGGYNGIIHGGQLGEGGAWVDFEEPAGYETTDYMVTVVVCGTEQEHNWPYAYYDDFATPNYTIESWFEPMCTSVWFPGVSTYTPHVHMPMEIITHYN